MERCAPNALMRKKIGLGERHPRAVAGVDYAVRTVHAFGLSGACLARRATSPVEFLLDLGIGTGRIRGLPEQGDLAADPVQHLRAIYNHPLDAGLLGLQSAYFMGKDALIGRQIES